MACGSDVGGGVAGCSLLPASYLPLKYLGIPLGSPFNQGQFAMGIEKGWWLGRPRYEKGRTLT